MGKTAKSSAERVRAYRERLKLNNEKYVAYKDKDNERKKAERQKVLRPSEISRQKMLNRERVKRYRQKQRAEMTNQSPQQGFQAYQTPQALGKALRKARQALPKSPRKRKAVVTKLVSPLKRKYMYSSPGNRGIPKETSELVRDFYQSNAISYQAPGRKDFVTIRKQQKKLQAQKRYLTWSLRETYGMFIKQYPTVKIGLSKFCSLRPEHVMLSADTPRDVCLCAYHENIKLLCQCLNKEVAEIPVYSSDFVDLFVCSSESEDCMFGRCDKCPRWFDDLKENLDPIKTSDTVTWYEWERVDQVIREKKEHGKSIKKNIKKMKKVCKEGNLEEVIQALEDKMPFFLEHVYVKRKQSKFFEDKKANLKSNEAIIQVDFAENYSCKYQDEVQSAHWNQQQVTIFTVAIWTKNGANITCESHAIVSDELSHEKKAVAVLISNVIDNLIKEKHPEISVVYIFSDGPSSQFKNRYIAHFLHTIRKSVDVHWVYFATAHGKGAVDGIGGTVKRMVWNAVSTRKAAAVTDAKSFAQVAEKVCTSIGISYISSEEMEQTAISLDLDKCFKSAPAIQGIKKYHMLEPLDNGLIRCRAFSYQNSFVEKGKELSSDSEVSDVSSESYEEGKIEESSDDTTKYDDKEEVVTGPESLHGETQNPQQIDSDEDEDCASLHGETQNPQQIDSDEDEDCVSLHGETQNPQQIDSDEDEDCADSYPQEININIGLPEEYSSKFNNLQFLMNIEDSYKALVESIVKGDILFSGYYLIDLPDLLALNGENGRPEDKWLCNFVIDSYLQILKTKACTALRMNIEVLSWEVFAKVVGKRPANSIYKEKLTDKDIILVPCNSQKTKHWFLLVVFPSSKTIIALDSMSKPFVKPIVHKAMAKMMSFLRELDQTIDIEQWMFFSSTESDLPQQANSFDCGVFVCLFARCIVTKGIMLTQSSIGLYRKYMILELHEQMLHPLPPSAQSMCGKYFAVDFVKKFYIGRALEVDDNSMVKFKFLHSSGAERFDWPNRDDIYTVHTSCVFFGPFDLQGNGPFHVPCLKVIEKLFKH